MKEINIVKWKAFRVGDLFDIYPTQAYKLTNHQLMDSVGTTPVLANSSYNNGIGGYSSKPSTEKGNIVTFSDTVDANTIFYQKNDFIGYPHVQGLYPRGEYKLQWGEYSYLFFVSVFRKAALTKGFNYGNKFRRDIAVDLIVFLPVLNNDKLDFSYMDSYMRKIMEDSKTKFDELNKVSKSKTHVAIVEWKEFFLSNLFDFKLPQGDIQVKKTEDGNTILITPSAFNNGVFQRISSKSKSTLFPANTLTVDMFGNSYFQEESYFVTAHGHVNVLLPKFQLNKYTGLFIATAIRTMFWEKYGFTQMCTLKVLKREKVKLPVLRNGDLNTEYMESYMRDILDKSSNYIDILSKVLS